MDIRKLLRGAGEFTAAQVDPQWKEKQALEAARLAQTTAQTGLIGAQTEGARAGTAREQAMTTTEGLRQKQIEEQLAQVAEDKAALEAAFPPGSKLPANAASRKAILDAQEAELRNTLIEAQTGAAQASAGHMRAATGEITDPTMKALKYAELRDRLKYNRARVGALEALTTNRQAGPARIPSAERENMALQKAKEWIKAETGSTGFFGFHPKPGLLPKTQEYDQRIAELKQKYYQMNPETAGGVAATVNLPQNLPDGIHLDTATGHLIMSKGGQVTDLGPADQAKQGLGSPGVEGPEPDVDY